MKYFLSNAIGAVIGTIAIWLCFFAITQQNPANLLGKIQIIIVDDEEKALSDTSKEAIEFLYTENLAISADNFLAQIGSFYSTVLQISLAAFVLFGFLSFLSIRWQSIQAAEDFADAKVKATFDTYIKSQEFNLLLSQKATDTFDIQAESLDKLFDEMMNYMEQMDTIDERLAALETQYGLQSSETEPEEGSE